MSRQRPVRKEKVCKDHMEHNSESVAVLSNVHLTWRNIFHEGAPICIQSTLPTCFLFLQVPRPLRPLSSHLLAHLALNAFSQSKPNITSHLPIVTSIYFSEELFLHSLRRWLCPSSLSMPLPPSDVLANLCPRHPTRYHAAPVWSCPS